MGTNMSPEWPRLLAAGEDGCHLANTLANAAVVSTVDGKVIMLHRSGNVGECPNTVVYPGGHPEPKDLDPPLKEIADWHAVCEPDAGWGRGSRIVDELFSSISREVCEETGLLAEELSEPLLIGIGRRRFNHRSVMVFSIKCTLTADQVSIRYARTKIPALAHSQSLTAKQYPPHMLSPISQSFLDFSPRVFCMVFMFLACDVAGTGRVAWWIDLRARAYSATSTTCRRRKTRTLCRVATWRPLPCTPATCATGVDRNIAILCRPTSTLSEARILL